MKIGVLTAMTSEFEQLVALLDLAVVFLFDKAEHATDLLILELLAELITPFDFKAVRAFHGSDEALK